MVSVPTPCTHFIVKSRLKSLQAMPKSWYFWKKLRQLLFTAKPFQSHGSRVNPSGQRKEQLRGTTLSLRSICQASEVGRRHLSVLLEKKGNYLKMFYNDRASSGIQYIQASILLSGL